MNFHFTEEQELLSIASAEANYQTKVVELQQKLAAETDVVMDGRDIGTVVLPDAEVKIFLTASVDVRAMRRYKELTEKGVSCNIDDIERDIVERDYRDMHREISPLKQADDAVLIDSSNYTIEEVAKKIIDCYSKV